MKLMDLVSLKNKRQIKSHTEQLASLGSGTPSTFIDPGNWKIIVDENGTLRTIPNTTPDTLVWSDEFTLPTIDLTKWTHETGLSLRNGEPQTFTTSGNNSFIRGGKLVLRAIKDTAGKWTSASLTTNNKFEFGNGRIEARIKLPNHQGVFPAFWCMGAGGEYDYDNKMELGDSWQKSTEVDIMEKFGKGNQTSSGVFYKPTPTSALSLSSHSTTPFDTTQFNVYGMERDANAFRFYVNNVLHHTVTITDPDNRAPMYLLINFSLGHIAGLPNETTPSMMEVEVDWIRFYTLGGGEIKPTSTVISKTTLDKLIGYKEKLEVTFSPTNTHNKTIVWRSSDESIVSVHGGNLNFKREGQATITATTDNGIVASCVCTSNAIPVGTIVASDLFNRVDGSVGSPDVGSDPTFINGTYSISGNKLMCNISAWSFILWDCVTNDVRVETKMTYKSSPAGISLRNQGEANDYRVLISAGVVKINIVLNYASYLQNSANYSFVDGVEYDVKCEIVGSVISVYINGVLVVSATDALNRFPSGSKHGIYTEGTTKFDNLVITAL